MAGADVNQAQALMAATFVLNEGERGKSLHPEPCGEKCERSTIEPRAMAEHG